MLFRSRRWVGVLVGVVVMVGGARADVVLEGVKVTRAPAPAVRLMVSGPVAASAHTLGAEGDRPARIYVDLSRTMLDHATPSVVRGAGDVVRIRAGQFDATTVRVVLDLVDAVDFTVRQNDGVITIALAAPPRRPSAPRAVPPPAPTIAAPIPTPARTMATPPPSPPARVTAAIPPPRAAIDLPPPPRPRAAAPPPTLVPPARTSGPKIVVLDAGHGGHDPGATGLDGVFEKTITLDLVRRVAARLADEARVDVVLTREDDTFVSLPERIKRASDAAVFVSLHANAAEDPGLSGVEIFYGGGGPQTASTGPGSPLRLGLDVISALGQRLPDVRTMMRPGSFSVLDRKSTRLNSSHIQKSRMPSSA